MFGKVSSRFRDSCLTATRIWNFDFESHLKRFHSNTRLSSKPLIAKGVPPFGTSLCASFRKGCIGVMITSATVLFQAQTRVIGSGRKTRLRLFLGPLSVASLVKRQASIDIILLIHIQILFPVTDTRFLGDLRV